MGDGCTTDARGVPFVTVMRILFLSGWYPPYTKGGAELSAHYVARGLRERGHDVVVISQLRDTRKETVVDGVPVFWVPISFSAKPLFERRWAQHRAAVLAAELARHKPFDIIHCHDFRVAQIVSLMNLPNIVVTVRDYAFICGSPNNLLADGSPCPGCENVRAVIHNRSVVEASFARKPFRIWQYWHNIEFRKKSLQAFPHQIYISQIQKDIIQNRLPDNSGRQTVIYNPLSPSYVTTRPERVVGHTILYVGTVESYKGVGLLLDAFKTIAARWPNVHLKIVGEGAAKKIYEEKVAQWGLRYRVSFAGHISPDRMRQIFDEAALVVAPHLWDEPFGRTVIEAMARERLVVAAKAGGPSEIIQDGVTGILFERGSQDALERALERALAMAEIDRREIQRSARSWVTTALNLERIAEQHELFYKSLM